MIDKTVHTCLFVFNSVLDRYMNQEMYDKVVSKKPFMLKHCLHRYKTKKCVIRLLILIRYH